MTRIPIFKPGQTAYPYRPLINPADRVYVRQYMLTEITQGHLHATSLPFYTPQCPGYVFQLMSSATRLQQGHSDIYFLYYDKRFWYPDGVVLPVYHSAFFVHRDAIYGDGLSINDRQAILQTQQDGGNAIDSAYFSDRFGFFPLFRFWPYTDITVKWTPQQTRGDTITVPLRDDRYALTHWRPLVGVTYNWIYPVLWTSHLMTGYPDGMPYEDNCCFAIKYSLYNDIYFAWWYTDNFVDGGDYPVVSPIPAPQRKPTSVTIPVTMPTILPTTPLLPPIPPVTPINNPIKQEDILS